MSQSVSKVAIARAAQLCEQGLTAYHHWDIEQAIASFKSAITLNSTVADYYLYLAQAYIRLSDYDAMRKALGLFIHLETDQSLIDRFEAFFGSAMDEVETHLTATMLAHNVPLDVIGAAIHMWLEFRLAVGRNVINMAGLKPKTWAASLDYTTRKVNIHEIDLSQLAAWYNISAQAVQQHYTILVQTLDIMPCDYRYFRGPKNPLDKLIEAAQLLNDLEKRFHQHF